MRFGRGLKRKFFVDDRSQPPLEDSGQNRISHVRSLAGIGIYNFYSQNWGLVVKHGSRSNLNGIRIGANDLRVQIDFGLKIFSNFFSIFFYRNAAARFFNQFRQIGLQVSMRSHLKNYVDSLTSSCFLQYWAQIGSVYKLRNSRSFNRTIKSLKLPPAKPFVHLRYQSHRFVTHICCQPLGLIERLLLSTLEFHSTYLFST